MKQSDQPMSSRLDCLLIADDLTGACDAAVHFSATGRTLAALHNGSNCSGIHVLALSAESRALPAPDVSGLMRQLAAALSGTNPRILFKKIDSTLRGHAGVEILSAIEAFGCDVAVVTPAFPAMGRVVESGWLRIEGDPGFAPIKLATYFREQGATAFTHVSGDDTEQALASGASFISVDAFCNHHLDRIVAAGLSSGRRVLWGGSAGLASALARALHGGTPSAGSLPQPVNRVIFCLGSDHPITMEQQANLLGGRPCSLLAAPTATAACVASALRSGSDLVLRIPRGAVEAARVRELLLPALESSVALALSGGDTASLVYRALGMQGIRLSGEITAGIPHGIVEGGDFDGRPIATKSGGFGAPDALMGVSDFFKCPKP